MLPLLRNTVCKKGKEFQQGRHTSQRGGSGSDFWFSARRQSQDQRARAGKEPAPGRGLSRCGASWGSAHRGPAGWQRMWAPGPRGGGRALRGDRTQRGEQITGLPDFVPGGTVSLCSGPSSCCWMFLLALRIHVVETIHCRLRMGARNCGTDCPEGLPPCGCAIFASVATSQQAPIMR